MCFHFSVQLINNNSDKKKKRKFKKEVSMSKTKELVRLTYILMVCMYTMAEAQITDDLHQDRDLLI